MTASLKPLVALYKTYRGGEWFGASLESVRHHCAGAVVVSSDAPWKDVGGDRHPPENCRAPLVEFLARHPGFPVTLARPAGRQDTTEQYKTGLSLVKWMYGNDAGVLIVDTDEVWDAADLAALRRAMADGRGGQVFRAGVRTYLRSPLWRVAPMEAARVVVGLANPGLPTGQSRFADLHKLYAKAQIRDVDGCVMHHFGYVRDDPDEITAKLENCTSQDRAPTVPDWKRQVWDRLPRGENLHPQRGFERCWGGVEAVGPGLLPAAALGVAGFWDRPEVRAAVHNDDPAWRRRVESLPPGGCPATTVPAGTGPTLGRALAGLAGVEVGAALLDYLVPKLRMSLGEALQLASWAAALPAGAAALEVGSGKGGSMAVLALAAPPGTLVTCVDPYVPYDEENVAFDRAVSEGSVEEFMDVLSHVAVERRGEQVRLAREPSLAVAPRRPDASLDLLLIDGNHSYGHCRGDLEAWWPKVKPGGVVLVHDYASRFPGVVRAVREFEAGYGARFALPAGSTLAWVRKG